MRNALDELFDLIVVDEVTGGCVGLLGGDLPHHLPDLLLGQRGVPQQREQRDPIGARNAVGIAGTKPVEDGVHSRFCGHGAKSRGYTPITPARSPHVHPRAARKGQKSQSSSSVMTALPMTYDDPEPEKKSWFSSALGDSADRIAGLTSVSSFGNSAS